MDSEHGGWEGLESERQTDKALIKNENIRKPNRRNNRREWRERERERERERSCVCVCVYAEVERREGSFPSSEEFTSN